MKFFPVALIFIFSGISSFAQLGNEWIKFNQQYFKIPIAKDGLYRLTYANLVDAGISTSVDPRKIQIFHRGVEQAIYVEGENDGQLNTSDYIEFYGRQNDGTLDTDLYSSPTAQPHKYYNLYSDTTIYFLTYGQANGKRMAFSQINNPGLPAQTFHWDEKLMVLTSQYSSGVDYGDIQLSGFDEGEGWMGNQIIQNQSASYTIEGISNTVVAAGLPSLEVLLVGRGPMAHAVQVSAGNRLLATVDFSGFQSYKYQTNLQWSDISADGKLTISAKVIGSPDRVSVGYILVKYPQQVDQAGSASKQFIIPENESGMSYVEIKNPAADTRLYDVTNPSNVIRIAATQTSTLNAVVENTTANRKLLAISSSNIPSIRQTSFRSINPSAQNYVIITHKLLRKPAGGYIDPVKAYGEYRSLPQGGGYDTLIVNIDQLYDQFNYGEQSPRAIFQFMKYLAIGKLPDFLLLMGKGLDVNSRYYRSPGSFPVYKDLVPTAGLPGSDMFYTAGLSAEGDYNGVATGRLSAAGPLDVAAYLNKVKETESLPFNDLRRKNILHLSGGVNPGEPQMFRAYLESFASVAKNYHLGGNVKAIAKQSTDIELINVADELNQGLNLITFFGHSSAGSSDFDIGFVTDPLMGYNNKGKYPLLLMNGCLAGSFFLGESIFGENWVNASNKGAIGMIAHTSYGFSSLLKNYSELFYKVAFADDQFINKGIGEIQREVAKRFTNTYGTGPSQLSQIQQMILLGDPAVKLFAADKADYEIRSEHVWITSFDGEPITALTDSFKINLVVQNFGKAEDQDLVVRIKRSLNNGSVIEYDDVFDPVFYSDTLTLVLQGNIENGFGINNFEILIDPENVIDELREDNNTVSLSYFIPLNGTRNLYPDNYSIVSGSSVKLFFQHTDLLSPEREFLLEFDTVNTFDSPFKKAFELKGTVLLSQEVDLLNSDTTAYYWRSKLKEPLDDESKEWDMHTFTFIEGARSGWAQVHFPQFQGNSLSGLVSDAEIREIKFKETITDVAIKTFGAATGKPADSVSLKINGVEYNIYSEGFGCRDNTINFVAFDKTTTQPYPGIFITWYDILFTYGGRRLTCGREPYVINSFTREELTWGNNADIIKYVDNIPTGDSVIIYNIGNPDYQNWPLAAKQKLGELGISIAQLAELTSGEPVVIRARKGANPGSAIVIRTTELPSDEQVLKYNRTVTGRVVSGAMTSTVVGPAVGWESFSARYKKQDATDYVSIDVYGIRVNREETLLLEDINMDTDLSAIDPYEYPYLRFAFKTVDEINLTPAQPSRFIITYQPAAEGVLLYNGELAKQTLFEGQKWNGNYDFVNISDASFPDSLVVNYSVINPQTFKTVSGTRKIASPAPGDATNFDIQLATVSHAGINDVTVFVNPRITPELNYDNNFIALLQHLEVVRDTKAPVLDVTFDGRHISNKEFVSSSPGIVISLWDNNPNMLKKDTTGIDIFIAYPCSDDSCPMTRIHFSSPDITWTGETDTSEFYVNYKPKDLADGIYVLRVEARDESGNSSGAAPYEISFQVKNESTISISSPFPNPFSDKAHFEILLTGETLPSNFSLMILNPDGKVVQQFTNADVNNLHIGTNIIEWSPVNDQGYELPGGIYFYKLIFTGGNQTVTKAGKLVFVR